MDGFSIGVFGAAGATVLMTGTCLAESGHRGVYLGSNEGRTALLTRGLTSSLEYGIGILEGYIYERISLPTEAQLPAGKRLCATFERFAAQLERATEGF